MSALPAGRPAAGAWLSLVLVLAAAALLTWALSPRAAFADDPPKPSAGAPVVPAPPAPTPTPTVDELDARLLKSLPSALAVVALRYVAGTAGLILLILAWVRARDIRRGLLPPPPPRPPPTAPFRLATCLYLFFGAIVAVTAVGAALRQAFGDHIPLWARLAGTGLPLLSLAAVIVVARRRARALGTGGQPVSAGEGVRRGLWTFLVFAAVGIVVQLAWGLLLVALGERPTPQELVTTVADGGLGDALAISAFGVLVAPFTEECLFRALLYPAARRVISPRAAALLVAGAFAAIHANLFALMPLFAFAIMLAWLFERTDSLVAVTVAHATFNASTLLPLLLLRDA